MSSMRLLRNAWLVAGVALAIRVAVVFATGEAEHAMGDTPDYLDAAHALVDGTPYPFSRGLPFWRAPGYPAAIALVWRVAPGSLMAVLLAQCAADVLGLLFVGRILSNTFGRTAAALGRWWYAVYPPFVLQATTLQTETWFQVALLGLTWILLPSRGRSPGKGRMAAAGIALGVAALIRPAAMLLLPLCVVWLALRDRKHLRSVALRAVVMSGTFSATLLPWAASNHARSGQWVPVTDAAWFSLWYTTTPAAARAVWEPRQAQPALDSLLYIQVPSMREGWPPNPIRARTAFWRGKTLDAVARDPRAFARYRLHGIWVTWRPWVTPGFYTDRAVAASVVLFLPWLILGWLGAVWAWRERPMARPFLGLVLAYALVATASNLVSTPVLRYRIPLVDPYFIGLASAWLATRLAREDVG